MTDKAEPIKLENYETLCSFIQTSFDASSWWILFSAKKVSEDIISPQLLHLIHIQLNSVLV